MKGYIMDKRKFDFEEKETYSKQEVEAILGQHTTFIGADKLETEITSLKGELQPFKTKARNDKIKSLLPDNANTEMFDDILSLARIDKDDDDKIIAEKLSKTIESRK